MYAKYMFICPVSVIVNWFTDRLIELYIILSVHVCKVSLRPSPSKRRKSTFAKLSFYEGGGGAIAKLKGERVFCVTLMFGWCPLAH